MKKFFQNFLFALCLFSIIPIAYSENAATNSDIQNFADMMAREYDIEQSYTYGILAQAEYRPDVIEKITKPAEKMPWYAYQDIIVTPERIQKGVKFMDKYKKILDWAYREYGVPQPIIVALLGIETKYGEILGNYRILDALVTLAFRYPPRAKFFKKELASFILLTYTQERNPDEFYGSYAGAMGMCQFMPSTYLHYAVDFQGQKYPDLFNDKADIIFSVGNFLRQHGWDIEKPIAAKAVVQGEQYNEILQPNSALKPKYTLAKLKNYGVTPETPMNSHLKAHLLKLDGKIGPEFWLGFHNYFIIKRYNNSHLYAMAVYQLSVGIQKAYEELLIQRKEEALTKAEEKTQYLSPRNLGDTHKKILSKPKREREGLKSNTKT